MQCFTDCHCGGEAVELSDSHRAGGAAQIGEIISKIDVEPKQFHVRLKLTVTDADGNRTTTISPQLITLNGQSATIAVGDPENGTTAIEVQVTEAATAEESHAAAGRARVSSIPSLQFRDICRVRRCSMILPMFVI